jgi:hypothetical protein
MFRIHKVFDVTTPTNRSILNQVQAMLRVQFDCALTGVDCLLGVPTLIVQEGGYRTQTLGINARHFFTGLWETLGAHENNGRKSREKN